MSDQASPMEAPLKQGTAEEFHSLFRRAGSWWVFRTATDDDIAEFAPVLTPSGEVLHVSYYVPPDHEGLHGEDRGGDQSVLVAVGLVEIDDRLPWHLAAGWLDGVI